MIDVEALIVASLVYGREERRLVELAAWWAALGARLVSVQRLRTVAARFPEREGENALGLFSALAGEAGDRRWARHTIQPIPNWIRRDRGPESMVLSHPSTVWLRLRAGLGVGAKADILAFLLGNGGGWASVQVMAQATGYTGVAVRTAVREMALGRLIREEPERPAEYLAPKESWAQVLDLPRNGDAIESGPGLPRWRFWSEIFAFFSGASLWSSEALSHHAIGHHVLASHARDLLEGHAQAFRSAGIAVPMPSDYPGLQAVAGLLDTVRIVADWTESRI